MSIAEKLTTIAENVQKVYDAGKAAWDAEKLAIYYMWDIDFAWTNVVFPENTELTLNFKNGNKNCNAAFSGAQNLKTLKLISEDNSGTVNLAQLCRECAQLELLDLTEYNRNCTSIFFLMYGSKKLKSILGALDLTNCTNTTNAFNATNALLEDIEFVPNTIKISINFSYLAYLSDISIQSIIDGLADLTGGTAQTLTVHKTVYEKIIANGWDALITAKNWILVSA